MKIEIVDFDKKYSHDIYELETSQWGVWDNEACIDDVQEGQIVLVALCDNHFAGLISGQIEDNVFHILICCIKPEFQNHGIGTLLMDSIIARAKESFRFVKFRAEAISVYGKSNAKKMLENAKFNLVRIDKEYWGKLYPHVLCTECGKKPCECDSLVYELNN